MDQADSWQIDEISQPGSLWLGNGVIESFSRKWSNPPLTKGEKLLAQRVDMRLRIS